MKSFIKNTAICIIVILSSFLFGVFCVEILFRKGPFFIIYHSIPIGLIISFLLSIILSSINLGKKFLDKRISIVVIIFLIFGTTIFLGWRTYSPSGISLIRKYITNKLPPSLTETKSSVEYPSIDHIIRIAFKISDNDFKLYVLNESFKPSDDNFPYSVPAIKTYNWWDSNKLKTYKQYKSNYLGGINYLWYAENEHHAYFMRIRQ